MEDAALLVGKGLAEGLGGAGLGVSCVVLLQLKTVSDIPRKSLAINDDLLLLVRAESDRGGPGATLGDLNVGGRLVGTSTEVDVISSSGGVDSRLDRSEGCGLGTRAAARRRNEDVFGLGGARESRQRGGELEDG